MLAKYVQKFKHDEDGVAAVELILSVPILVWALLSTHVYFDAFKTESLNTRANLTIADMFSREGSVNAAFINGAESLLNVLTSERGNPSLRVTSYYFDDGGTDNRTDDDRYILIWSEKRGNYYSPHTNASLAAVSSRLPVMADNDTSLLVETHTPYTAPFSIGIGPFVPTNLEGVEFENFTAIRPRFEGEVCFGDGDVNDTCKP